MQSGVVHRCRLRILSNERHGMEMILRSRKASEADMDLLFRWANDPAVRSNAFHTEQIPYEDHVKWFTKMMADASVYQYILCDGEFPVGQFRLNIEDNAAVIDYSVASAYRGQGYGSRMLRMIPMQIVQDKIPNVTELVGQVKYGNNASARAFESCGYAKQELPAYIQYTNALSNALRYEI